ncbi:conserved hypothetical protein [Histoplasma capsulatum G186AR]|uniref:Acyltransferase MbtK/IucB-like conserved domain-containing protein n=2 Tax=Ajellomyces capsulatus TaxID=5037 RepID=C0P1A4_AJECG|nr:uncharacterized protein HCBG_09184 [Histoplasma capsulatum G186AR]EEH02575.1 conserved hypothetical protein [Histoplasma capsulatum G186AR]KAG5299851.1 siderophore biosynthesis protein [Histoplasma capsulatum]QSS67521.1 siderophore biosynthesis protein [Histoplasma capsulatum G186AR]
MSSFSVVHLPNGLSLSITPVFGGISFKLNEIAVNASVLPPGWTIVIQTEKNHWNSQQENLSPLQCCTPSAIPPGEISTPPSETTEDENEDENSKEGNHHSRFTTPTLNSDSLFISSISLPSASNFKPATSPTRQIAMLLYSTLWWYFHQPAPNPQISTEESKVTPDLGKPKGEWRVYIRLQGIFKGKHLMQKLERMGLVRTTDSFVGCVPVGLHDSPGWANMFASRRTFWQIDPRIFLFKLSPRNITPRASELPGNLGGDSVTLTKDMCGSGPFSLSECTSFGVPSRYGDPFASGSNLPTFFPPPPLEFISTNGILHPLRQKPPQQGEVFYTRYIPSLGQTLSFRVPSLPSNVPPTLNDLPISHKKSGSATSISPSSSSGATSPGGYPSDLALLSRWMNNPRVSRAWGLAGPQSVQENFLQTQLNSRHSFPAFGCWDGRPFGYFEIYWVKEDALGRLLPGPVGNYDRGIHCLVGEEEFRGPHRAPVWLSSLVHFCWLADNRTDTIMMEPRVDNTKIISYLQAVGFSKDGEVTFPHKQSALMRIRRENWEAPLL